MAQATEKLVGILVEHPEILALSMGPLLHTIDSQLAAAAHGAAAAEPRLRLWCGHDTTIMPIMRALDIELARWPPYCSNVVRPGCLVSLLVAHSPLVCDRACFPCSQQVNAQRARAIGRLQKRASV